MGHEDMRKYIRIARDMVVSVKERHISQENGDEVRARTLNLGEGGVFIEMSDPPEKGTIVEIEFIPPHANKPIRTLGIVRWQSSEPSTPGMGVKFAPVDEEERTKLLNLVREVSEGVPEIDEAEGIVEPEGDEPEEDEEPEEEK